MKKLCTVLLCIILGMTYYLPAQIVNINPDPNGEPWWAGGDVFPEEEDDYFSLPYLPLLDSTINLVWKVDNSQKPYFRSIFRQDGHSCLHASEIGYIFTYMINRQRNTIANDSSNLYPTHFTYNYVGKGRYEMPDDTLLNRQWSTSWHTVNDLGCPDIKTYGGLWMFPDDDSLSVVKRRRVWMTGYEKYQAALSNRVIENIYRLEINTPEDLDLLKHWVMHLAEGDTIKGGGLAKFTVKIRDAEYVTLLPPSYDAGKKLVKSWGTVGGHAMTIVGYNDSIMYDFDNNGIYTNPPDSLHLWEVGAVKLANSYGDGWLDSGFVYMPYRLFANTTGLSVITVRDSHTPKITMKARIQHPRRHLINIITGISNYPEAINPDTIQRYNPFNRGTGSSHPMQGINNDPIEMVFDLTSLVNTGVTGKFFLKVMGRAFNPIHQGTISELILVDHDTHDSIPIEIPYTEVPVTFLSNDTILIPIKYDYIPAFINTEIRINREFEMNKNVSVVNSGELILESYGHFIIDGDTLTIKDGGRFEIESCASIEITNGGLLLIEIGGEICVHPGAVFIIDSMNNIHFEEGFSTGDCLEFTPESFELTVGLTTPNIIRNPTTWDNKSYFFHDGLIIESGVTLNVTGGSSLRFGPGKSLIVEPGAKLIVDGSTITNLCANKSWDGIQVWGDNTKSQYPDNGIMHQGQVIVTSGALIENATTAIYAGLDDAGFGNPSYNGGIVMASSSEFRNNETSIYLPPYENFHPVNEEPRSNLSYVENCDFILADSDLTDFDPQFFIRLDGVSGISLTGNHFINQVSDGNVLEITGIQSLNSSFIVDKACNDLYTPCQTYRLSTFENLLYGIRALGAATAKTFTVDTSIFISNRIGVYVNAVDNFSVIRSDFLVENPDNAELEILCGVYVENESLCFSIEENTFTGPDNLPEQNTGIGITLNNTGPSNNELYNNTFTGLYIGTLAKNVNRDKSGTGLCIRCNHYTGNDYDIAVTYNELLYEYAGIAPIQGSAAPSPDAPAGNRFSWAGDANTPTDINNLGEHITYYYHVEPSEKLKPVYFNEDKVTIAPNEDAVWDPILSCPSNLNPPEGGRDEEMLRGMMADAGQEAESTQWLINALKDAGDTDALYWDVNMSASWQSLEVYNELMSVAPYVSDSVLEAAIEKENVLVAAMLRDVLVANPHSAKSDALMDKLGQRIDPLPEYMLDEILQGQSLVSVYEKLQSTLAYHRRKQALYHKQLVQLYLNDQDHPQAKTDSLVNLLLGSNIPAHSYQAAFFRYEQGDKASSANILSSMPSVFGFNAEQLSKHADILALLEQENALRLEDKSLLIPDNQAAAWLMDMMDFGNKPSNIYARNILLAHGLVEHYPPYLLPDGTKSRKDKRQSRQISAADEALKLFPNPARDYVIIDFDLGSLKPVYGNGLLRVSNIEGKEIETHILNKTRDQVVFSIKDYQSGTYLFMLYYNGRMVASKRLIIN